MTHVTAQAIQFDFISEYNIRNYVSCKAIRISLYSVRYLLSEALLDSMKNKKDTFDISYRPSNEQCTDATINQPIHPLYSEEYFLKS